MRIAIGGFQHESLSFAPRPTTWADFLNPGGFPPVQRPATLVAGLRDTAVPASGAIRAAEAAGIAIAPLCWGFAYPAGPVAGEIQKSSIMMPTPRRAEIAAASARSVAASAASWSW